LSSLSQRFGDIVWKLLFEEVAKFACVTSSSLAESGQNLTASTSNEESTRDKENHDDPWEEERSWRDPSAHNVRSVVMDWDDIQSTRRAIQVSLIFYVLFQSSLTLFN
jgi:U3 small nucleolar RNA-associated protein 20